jgi:adenylate kinase family enzyme
MIKPAHVTPAGSMNRVVVIGTSCAGKTAFARSLACALSFPHVELDALFWQPNWTPRPSEEFRKLVAQELSQGCWVTDGNYNVVRDLVWSRATTVIWLNYVFPLVLWRALTRTVRRVMTQEELFSGNRESLRMASSAASRFCGGFSPLFIGVGSSTACCLIGEHLLNWHT